MGKFKELAIEQMQEEEDENMRERLFELHQILLAKESVLVEIAMECSTFLEFQDIVVKWLKDDTVHVPRKELKEVWESISKIDDLVNMRKED